MPPEYNKYRVRVKDNEGNLHFVMVYARTVGEAKINGRTDAERLLKCKVTVEWCKTVV